MRVLLHCTTEFQLISAISIRYHLLQKHECDIIVDNYHGKEQQLAERIRSTGLFSHVAYIRSEIEHSTLHKYFRNLTEGKNDLSLRDACRNTFRFLKMRLMQQFVGEQAYIAQMVVGVEALDFDHYSQFVGYGSKPSTCNLALYEKKHNVKCKFFILDEGIGSYYEPQIAKFQVAPSGAYIFEPDLAVYKSLEIHRIPRLDPTDERLLGIINRIFDYHGPYKKMIANKAIFFDQGVSGAMPVYLEKMPKVLRIIFHNTYTRHKREEESFKQEIAFSQSILQQVQNKDIWVKLHPRTSEDTKTMWKEQGKKIYVLPNSRIPWEIFVLNNCFENNIFITYASSSVCMLNACIEGLSGNRSVFCYAVHQQSIHEGAEKLLSKINMRYRDVFIPQSMKELQLCVNDIPFHAK